MGRVVEGSYGYLLFCCGGIVEGVNFFIVLFLIGYLVKGIVVISQWDVKDVLFFFGKIVAVFILNYVGVVVFYGFYGLLDLVFVQFIF